MSELEAQIGIPTVRFGPFPKGESAEPHAVIKPLGENDEYTGFDEYIMLRKDGKLKYAVEKHDSSDQDPVYINGDENGIVCICGKRHGLRLPVGEHEITIERDD